MGQVEEEYYRDFKSNVTTNTLPEVRAGNLCISASVATFQTKGEDRHSLTTVVENPKIGDCQRTLSIDSPRIVAFGGVFDGHDGSTAAEYCSIGLLPHILIETNKSLQARRPTVLEEVVKAVAGYKRFRHAMEKGYIAAFHAAQNQFADDMQPPTLVDVQRHHHSGPRALLPRQRSNKSLMKRLVSPKADRPGGTTASTLSIYSGDADFTGGAKPFAVVAHCGDSRILTDDGLGTASSFRQVTVDHRPTEPEERKRLREWEDRGEAIVQTSERGNTTRIFPGGLAVSRTIGDVGFCSAVIPTPDVSLIELSGGRRQRFVSASDGLWNFVTNEQVGKLAAQTTQCEGSSSVVVDPATAASRLIKECLKNGQGQDDATIIVMDVIIDS